MKYYLLSGDSRLLDCGDRDYVCYINDDFATPSVGIIVTIIGQFVDNRIITENSYTLESVHVLKTQLTDFTDNEILKKFLHYVIPKGTGDNLLYGDGFNKAELLKRLQKYIEIIAHPLHRENRGIGITSVNFSQLMSNSYDVKSANKLGFFKCRFCGKFHKSENYSENADMSNTCKDCNNKVFRCLHCNTLSVKKYKHKKYPGYVYCSKQCAQRYTPRIPRYGNYSETLTKMKKNTTENITGRYFGVELEVVDSVYTHPYSHLKKYWKSVGDASIESDNGDEAEFVSAPLTGDNGLKSVNELVDYLIKIDAGANDSCGYHLHVDISDYSAKDLYKLAQFCKTNEKLFYTLMSDYRKVENSYCRPISYRLPESTDGFTVDDMFLYIMGGRIPKNKTYILENHKENKKHGERYRWVNFCPFANQGTFEVRLLEGTVSREVIIYWIKFWNVVVENLLNNKIKSDKQYSNFNKMFKNCEFKNKDLITDFFDNLYPKFINSHHGTVRFQKWYK